MFPDPVNPEALALYNNALEIYEHGVFHRKLLDDLRLAPDMLLRATFSNDKSLENQIWFRHEAAAQIDAVLGA